ncbi:hypothetical protein ACJH7A_30425, partial [Mycobacterium sp. SMC-17]
PTRPEHLRPPQPRPRIPTTPGDLAHVAAKLNNRPRKPLDWKTPAQRLDELLSDPSDPPAVALGP